MLHYQKSGAGNTIVLLHGFCENSTCFKEQVFFLQQYFTVITPDLPGFGNSQSVAGISLEGMADAVHEVLQKEGVKSCVMIGHSMGGYVTLAFANKYSGLLSGFGLLHSTAYADSDEKKQKRDQAIRVIREKGMESYVTNFVPPLFAPTFTDRTIIDELVNEAKRTTAEGLIAALEAMKGRPDHTALLASTSLPVFLGVGKRDSVIAETDMFAQAAMCRQADVTYFENSAHMGYVEEPEKCNQALQDFFNTIFISG